MATQKVFLVKFTVVKPGFKSFVLSGVVLASTQVIAVETATKTVQATLDEEERNRNCKLKLLSAAPMKTDFFFIAEENTNK